MARLLPGFPLWPMLPVVHGHVQVFAFAVLMTIGVLYWFLPRLWGCPAPPAWRAQTAFILLFGGLLVVLLGFMTGIRSLVVFGAAAVLAALSRWLLLTIPAMLLCGAAWVLALATFNATVQTSAPRWVVGRALSQYQVVTFGGIALGSWLWGLTTERYGVPVALASCALVMLVGIAIGKRFALKQTDTLNLDPLARWQEPAVKLEIQPRSGPIVVSVEYRIREENVIEFLRLMNERRRIRRRDGAQRWSLLRDLADPEIWIERFQAPTWLEYVRMHQRATQEDAAVGERIRALHVGPEPPRVRRTIERQTTSPPDAGRVREESYVPLTGPHELG